MQYVCRDCLHVIRPADGMPEARSEFATKEELEQAAARANKGKTIGTMEIVPTTCRPCNQRRVKITFGK